MAYKMKSGGKKMAGRKMKMGGSFIEPDKELKFGGPKKYGNGGNTGMGSSAGKQANYGSRNKAAEEKNKADNDLLSVKEKLTLSYEEKQKLIAERKEVEAAKAKNDSAETKKAAEFYTRGQVGTPKSKNNDKNKEAAEFYTRGQVGKSKESAPKPKAGSDQQSSGSSSTPPKAAPQSVNRVQAKSVPTKPVEQKLQTKPKMANYDALVAAANKSESTPTSKKAQRIDRRAKKVTDRKSKDRMANKAARINRRADLVEARKEKKSEIAAAKARLKAARRLESGGLKTPSEDQKGLKKLPTAVRNKMGYKRYGGKY